MSLGRRAATFPCQTGIWYWMKLCKTPGTLRGKAWRDGEPEPADWMVSWTGFDEALTGYPALLGASGGPGVAGSTVSFAECHVVRIAPGPTAFYAKRSTWQETMIASLEALAREQAATTPSEQTVFSARLESLWRRVQRDFSDRQSRRQMAWERQDGIWQQDGPLVTAAVLGHAIRRRYAGRLGRRGPPAGCASEAVR